MDLHAGQIQGFFSRPVDHMTAMPVLTQFVQDQLEGDDLVIIAPDAMHFGYFASNTIMIFLSGLIIGSLALLADLIVRSRSE